ncbi:methyltransferase LaeA [Pseudomassariella vexata]|uniref:Methyltransferase LaeA n=1 Tax=Pseudomassariella vexata TaxID=1141098 RepID=A0A1Y2D6Y9_9PEZI|nr:methyltransferase LaeA [Pseudomassariella vexata]ORY54836.1 methyltransferase LaeA [Pseudomassariella vexata]
MAFNGYSYNGGPPPVSQPEPATNGHPHFQENGRFYGTFKAGHYLFPCDEEELDRMDIFHKFFLVSRQYDSVAGLHQRPLPPGVKPRILDLGCGTGIWAIDMAEKYYNQEPHVIGWDLSLSQPSAIPPNTQFFQRDMTDPNWDVEPDSFDLVFMRMLAGSVKDWQTLYRNVFSRLKPGSGVFEHVEIDFRPHNVDGSAPQNSRLAQWARELHAAFDRFGKPLLVTPDPEHLLKQAGFVDVEHLIKDVPFHPWPEDEHKKDIGRWFNLGMTQGIEALTMAPLTRMRGFTREQVLTLAQDVRKEIGTRSFRVSCTMHIWTAKRPLPTRY